MRRLLASPRWAAASALIVGAAIAALVAALVWPGGRSVATSNAPSMPLVPPLRFQEILVPPISGTSGHLTMTPTRLRCGLDEIVGTHAESYPHGQFCLVRVAISNDDTYFHTWNAARTTLDATDGGHGKVDDDVMYGSQQIWAS